MVNSNNSVYEINAAEIGDSATLVPKDIADTPDTFRPTSGSAHRAWSVKLVNDTDTSLDLEVAVSTTDDPGFSAYAEPSGADTAASAPEAPDKVAMIFSDELAAGLLNAKVTPEATATTGTATITFTSKRMK